MNLGKTIALFLGGLIVVLMIYMLLSSDSNSTLVVEEPVKTQPKPAIQTTASNDGEFQTSDELKKIKELKQSVAVSSDGVSKLYLQSCAPCHAKDGSGVLAPSIIGKSKDEILARLNDYKAGKVPNSLMEGLLDNVSDENLTILADEISKFK